VTRINEQREKMKKTLLMPSFCSIALAFTLISYPAWGDPGIYRLEPFTLQQSIRHGEGEAQRLTGRFLTMTLSLMARSNAARYEHLLPAGPDEPQAFALKVKAGFFLDRNAPLGHPFEQPLSKILMYWGCGEKAGGGQPKVFDAAEFDDQLARVLTSSMPATHAGSRRQRDEAVAHRNALFPEGAGMRGLHEVRAGINRTQFMVDEQSDFLAPINITEARVTDRGATVRWERVPGASAYFVNMYVHPARSPVALIWTSSRVPETGFALTERHPGGTEMIRLLDEGVLMRANSHECTIPPVMTRYRDHAISIQVHAFGPETVIHAASREEVGLARTIRIAPRATTTSLLLKLDGADQQQALRRF
jgi:hypothetical protein